MSVCAPWAVAEDDACAPCTADTPDLDKWIGVASELLYELSGQRFPGVCEDTVRPCAQCRHSGGGRYYGGTEALWHGSGYTMFGSCGCGSDRCGCAALSEITLTGWPLVSVDEVLIDGAVLDPTAYRIDDWKTLVRIDGEQWPACQDLSLATTEADTFSIEFTYGYPPPAAGVAAAAEWACQLALGCAGDSACRLPQRVQTITRQGLSMTLLDPQAFLDDGLSGLGGIVDQFIVTYGPKGKNRWPAMIVNPDMQRRVRRTTS